MRIETHVVIRAVAFCAFATAVAITGEKEMDAYRAKEAAAKSVQAHAEAVEDELAVTPDLAKKGESLYAANGCVACHSTDGSTRIGPSFFKLYGKTEKLADGSTVKVDQAYIRESLMKPSFKVVAGYTPTMPSFSGSMQKQDQDAIIVWLKTLH